MRILGLSGDEPTSSVIRSRILRTRWPVLLVAFSVAFLALALLFAATYTWCDATTADGNLVERLASNIYLSGDNADDVGAG